MTTTRHESVMSIVMKRCQITLLRMAQSPIYKGEVWANKYKSVKIWCLCRLVKYLFYYLYYYTIKIVDEVIQILDKAPATTYIVCSEY